ncbi:hypothetical protein BDR26DRAFT_223239 [Obelidium mucronatum]|nr:hypothetical protein BDR26DRAFT_223239 [Obelidium mucronatum]
MIFSAKAATLVNGGFMELDEEFDDVEVIELSPPQQLSQSLPFRLSISNTSAPSIKRPSIIDKSSSFTSQVRFSPLSTHSDLKLIAQTLMALLKSLPLDPWDYADLVTDIDTAVHLHSGKDAYWARDVLMIGVSLSKAALLSLKQERISRGLNNKISTENGAGGNPKGSSLETQQRMKDTMDFFRVILKVGEESCYRARKLIKTLQGGWYVYGVSMEELAEKVCVEDRWWKKIQGK